MSEPNDHELRKQLSLFLTERLAHVNVDDVMDDFPLKNINDRIPGISYSPWELLEHLRITQEDIINFLTDPDYRAPAWPDEYWPSSKENANEEQWTHALKEFKKGTQWLQERLKEDDLFKAFTKNPKYTLLREVLIIIDHNSHHLGQMIFFRKYFNSWNHQ